MKFLFLLLFILGCGTAPKQGSITRVSGVQLKELQFASQNLKRPVQFKEGTLLLDVRPFFDYSMGHFVGAKHLDAKGVFEAIQLRSNGVDWQKRFMLKVALLGADLTTPIIVIGRGKEGEGEEGLVAWALLHVGFQNVQMTGFGGLKLRTTLTVDTQTESSEVSQKLKPEKRLWIEVDKIEDEIKGNTENLVIIDVRDPRMYLANNLLADITDSKAHVVNIFWKEFVKGNGQIEMQLKAKLESIKIGSKKRILVLSDQPSQAATATVALLSMDYYQVSSVFSKLVTE